MNNSPSKIQFVYNANSGQVNAALDWAHKIISPATYNCSLCSITYGNWGMKKEWKLFLQQLPFEVEFIYKDNFEQPEQNLDLPAVIQLRNEQWSLLISASELKKTQNCSDLIALLQQRLVSDEAHKTNNSLKFT